MAMPDLAECPRCGGELVTKEQFRAHIFCWHCRRAMLKLWGTDKIVYVAVKLGMDIAVVRLALLADNS
jgi:hypothetical protein